MGLSDVRVAILRVKGTQCDDESRRAVEAALIALGHEPTEGQVEVVHQKQFELGRKHLDGYTGLWIAGGFSMGDRVRAGIQWARRLMDNLGDQLYEFDESGKAILGICNGCQVLAETGLVPGLDKMGKQQMSLIDNDPKGFYCGWVDVKASEATGTFLKSLYKKKSFRLPVANGEGRFYMGENTFHEVVDGRQVALRYMPEDNYCSSMHCIAGIYNPRGNVLAMMPHPERAFRRHQQPDWTRNPDTETSGLEIVKGFVAYQAKL